MLVCIVRAGATFPEAPHPAMRLAAKIHLGLRCHRGPSNAGLGVAVSSLVPARECRLRRVAGPGPLILSIILRSFRGSTSAGTMAACMARQG